MTWAKLDDGILDNPKIAQVGVLGFAWYAAGLVYCNRNLTNGFIPQGIAERLLGASVIEPDGKVVTVGVTCGMQGDDLDPRRVIGWLVAANLWHVVRGGYQVHDFLSYNPSKEKVVSERERWRERQSRHRSRRDIAGDSDRESREESRRDSPMRSQGDTIVTPASPVPDPVPREEETAPPTRAREATFAAVSERLEALNGPTLAEWIATLPVELRGIAERADGAYPAVDYRVRVAYALHDHLRGGPCDAYELACAADALRKHGLVAFHRAWLVYVNPATNPEKPGFVRPKLFVPQFGHWLALADGTPLPGGSHDRRDSKRTLGAHGTDDYAADLARAAARRPGRLGALS